ncbi:MAG: tyrosine-type recombinase/integrase [Deltaproteobacteria bacterium]|nr:tyrosine-type recombinase/integrase [Deltaproteobacteria bacterium]
MGLLVECPECKKRNSQKVKVCKCGFALAKYSGRVYWIEWYQDGYRKRERIGPNKEAAEQRLREVLSARAEGRHIKKSPDIRTKFQDLAQWYLNLPEVQAKKTYRRDIQSLNRLLPHFKDWLLKHITPGLVEAYRQKRLTEPSGRSPQHLTRPATVNRELACLKTIFNKAIKNGKAERNPAMAVKLLRENNVRDRVLTPEEYTRLLTHCPAHLKPIVKLAYYTGMRQGEILSLTWGQVDLKDGFIELRPEDCKTNEGRLVPLNSELITMFKGMVRGLPGVKVFTYKGRSVASIKKSFITACRRAGLNDFTFHDLRHTAINNWRLQGHDYFRIMAASGHKTMSVFKRYNTVTKEELKNLVGKKI